MADAAFTVKVDGRSFTLNRITLGDWRMLKTEFGLNPSDITTTIFDAEHKAVEILNVTDPNVLAGLMVAALRHERPDMPNSSLIAEVEALTLDELEFPDFEEKVEEDPTPAVDDADSEATEKPAKSGNQAKRPKKPGTQH